MLVVHPTGNQNSRHAARAFAEVGRLDAFITALSVSARAAPIRFLPDRLLDEARRRDFSMIGGKVVSVAPLSELMRLASRNFNGRVAGKPDSIDRLYRKVDCAAARYLARHADISAVYCYEDAALETFRVAKAAGVRCIYELPIGYWREHRRIKAQEAQRRPDWAQTWNVDKDSAEKCQRKDDELALADQIIVASAFTERSLARFPGTVVASSLLPYGCPSAIDPASRNWYKGGVLKLLFVGELSQRKGLADVLEVVTQFGPRVQLSLIGSGPGAKMNWDRASNIRLLGSRSHDGVLEEMRRNDVLLFPSLFEGFGMVITEAMSQGLAVIASDCTGLPAVADGDSAIQVTAGVPAQLSEAIEGLLRAPDKVESLGRAALQRAARWQWQDYRANLRQLTLGATV